MILLTYAEENSSHRAGEINPGLRHDDPVRAGSLEGEGVRCDEFRRLRERGVHHVRLVVAVDHEFRHVHHAAGEGVGADDAGEDGAVRDHGLDLADGARAALLDKRPEFFPAQGVDGAFEGIVDDFDAHGASGAGYDLYGALDIDSVELVFLDFGDFLQLFFGNLANFFKIWLAATFFYLDSLADEVIYGLAEAGPVEGPILVDLDVDDNVFAIEFFGFFIEGVDELHHVESPLTEGATDGGAGGGAATWDAELEVPDNFFCHSF